MSVRFNFFSYVTFSDKKIKDAQASKFKICSFLVSVFPMSGIEFVQGSVARNSGDVMSIKKGGKSQRNSVFKSTCNSCNCRITVITVFENHIKSLILYCERSELCLHFELTKVH